MTERLLAPPLLGAAAAGLCIAAGVAIAAAGPVPALMLVSVAAVFVLVRRPAVPLALLLGTTIAIEGDKQGFLAAQARFYDPLPLGPVLLSDVLLVAVALSVALELARRGIPPLMPRPFTPALLLLVLAAGTGLITGYFDGGRPTDIFDALRILAYLVVLPVVVVNIVRTQRHVMLFAAWGAALAVFKGLEGSVAWLLGEGRQFEETTLTFYNPAPNWLMLAFLLSVLAVGLARVPVPPWVYVGAVPAFAALVLSFRRSFWIAAVLGLVLVVAISRAQPGRRLAVFSAVLVVAALGVTVAYGGSTESQARVVERARSLAPAKLEATKEDRYRLVEQRNVVAELRDHPLTGIGLGTEWKLRYPLPETHPGGRLYTHVVVFWYWLKLGLIGLAAYLFLITAAIVTTFRLSRGHPDALVRAVSLGLAAAIAGLAVAETSGSFTGVSMRFTIVFGAVLGWVAAASRTAAAARRPSAAQRTAST